MENTQTAKIYAIYVADDNGWIDSCPDAESVFFGRYEGATYVHPVDGGSSLAGELRVATRERALEILQDLETSGDWRVGEEPFDGGAPTEEVVRPRYAIREVGYPTV